MSRAPLWEAVRGYALEGTARFHTPGHSGRAGAALPSAFAGILPCDQTEIPGLDSLYEADGPIADAEAAAAALYGASRTLFSAGGCTLAIQAMLYLALREGDPVAMDRRSHRAAIHACALLDAQPRWLYPGGDGRISPASVESLLRAQPDIRAVYITSPDYYGRLCDIPAIAAICREKGVPLLVDNAHGSHLAFLRPDLHPLHLGADMTADSAHKTLPALTGGAFLHIKNPAFAPTAKSAMALFGSTSPSYPVMASLDLCRAWLKEEGEAAFAALAQRVRALEETCRQAGVPVANGLRDPVRLTLETGELGMSGQTAEIYFRQQGCQAEHADGSHIVFILTPFHTQAELDRLAAAIRRLPYQAGKHAGGPIRPAFTAFPEAETVLTLRQAVFRSFELLPVDQALGRVAAETACPCPPGVPVVIPGEKITRQAQQILLSSGISSLKVVK